MLFLFSSTILLFNIVSPFNRVYAASIMTSGGGNVITGQTITVTISANHPDPYNAITVNVNYSNLSYLSATVIGGWTPIVGPTKSGNTISFTGALLGGTASGGNKGVLSISFKAPDSPGTATVSSSGTIALADGSGTQISAGGSTVTYSVKAPPPPPSPTPTPTPAPGPVNVSSSTHPDQNQWYKVKDVTFNWNQETGVTDFSYVFDTEPNTNPDDISEGIETTKTYLNVSDGTYYFHIKAKNKTGWGPVSRFVVNIDNSSPDPFTPTVVKNLDNTYKLFFSTNDGSSQSLTYFVKIDDLDLGETKSGVNIPPGTKSVIVTAIDKAGNTQVSGLDLEQYLTLKDQANAHGSILDPKANNKPNNTSCNNVVLIISFILALIYALIITIMYLAEKGVFKRNSVKNEQNMI